MRMSANSSREGQRVQIMSEAYEQPNNYLISAMVPLMSKEGTMLPLVEVTNLPDLTLPKVGKERD